MLFVQKLCINQTIFPLAMKQYSQRKAIDRCVHDFKIYEYENCHDYPICSQSKKAKCNLRRQISVNNTIMLFQNRI